MLIFAEKIPPDLNIIRFNKQHNLPLSCVRMLILAKLPIEYFSNTIFPYLPYAYCWTCCSSLLSKNFPQQQAIGRTWSWLSPADYHNGTIGNNNNSNNNNTTTIKTMITTSTITIKTITIKTTTNIIHPGKDNRALRCIFPRLLKRQAWLNWFQSAPKMKKKSDSICIEACYLKFL